MFERFIVATDLSQATFALVNCLGGLKFYGAQHCLLLQCISLQEGASLAYSYHTAPVESRLYEQQAILEKQGFTVEARSVFACAKREVNRIALHEDYSLIVVGSQGQSLIAEKALGGVAFRIISKAEKPVLVMPVEKMPGDENVCKPIVRYGFSDHILLARDFSDIADRAFTFVEQMVACGVKQVTLLHVQDKARIHGGLAAKLDEFNDIDRRRLEQLAARLKEQGPVEVQLEIPYGLPKQEIVQRADLPDVSLIVMGTQGRGFLGEFFLGSVAAHVARRSSVPTLLVPPLRSPA
jgi:nucleotide-binding universal stress UspA family protein